NKVLSAQQQVPMIMDEPAPGFPTGGLPGQQAPPPVDSESKPWFGGGWFGENKKKDEIVSGGGSETKVLESFDAPPVPNFE
ncbi:mitochondrial-like import inner membrane translocase subunit TIM17-2-like, partial [Trifolium medium]|nr:mitochondrial-like import inner membrane translocase subunit TIM17-2-like [Trifolium medium]